MNAITLKGNWKAMKDKVRQRWGRLTQNDVEQIDGRGEQLLGKVQRAYGLSREEAQRQVAAFEESCGCGKPAEGSHPDHDEPKP